MTKYEHYMTILHRAIATHSAAAVARRINVSDSLISQLKNEKYPGDVMGILELVVVAFGDVSIDCPVLGADTALSDCLDARTRADRPLIVTSGQSAKLYRACQTCQHKGGGK